MFIFEEDAEMVSSFLWWVYGEGEMFETHRTP